MFSLLFISSVISIRLLVFGQLHAVTLFRVTIPWLAISNAIGDFVFFSGDILKFDLHWMLSFHLFEDNLWVSKNNQPCDIETGCPD